MTKAYERGVKVTGATAHYVTAELDEGPIVEQIVEHVYHCYTPDMLVAQAQAQFEWWTGQRPGDRVMRGAAMARLGLMEKQ